MKTTTISLAILVAIAGCDDDTTTLSGNLDMSVADMAAVRTADVPLTFQAQGLWWDATTQALYIANDAQQIVRWNEPGPSFSVVASLPQIAPNAGGLGQLVKARDGSWLVTRFGFGVAGAVLQVKPDGSVATVGGLNVKRRRIGLTVAPDGTVYDGWFLIVPPSKLPMMGSVSKLALDGSGETDVVSGIGKPVGVLALGDSLYVSDQLNGVIVKTPLASPGATTMFATLAGADELAAGPNGTIFAVTSTGSVQQLSTSGTPTSIKDGYKALRGVAWDGDHKRLFVSEPDAGTPDGGAGMPMLHVLPIN